MQKFYLVTGNSGKAAAFKRLLPSNLDFELVDLDLPEIQSMDTKQIVADKAMRAYAAVGKPVLVEDVSAGLAALNGLPGPFIKYFENQMGADALYQLTLGRSVQATVISTLAYYDGVNTIICEGVVEGTAVAARGKSGFGFDACFMPSGQTKTYAEMTDAQKDAISHRTLSVKQLLTQLNKL